MVKEKFYITTTIPYANAPPHIGFTLELVQADVLARWHKLKGKDVFFLTGTDEHGVKNYQTAKKQGINTQKFVDKNSDYFKKLTKSINCSNNYFIRTTDKKVHWPGVVEMWNLLLKKGDIVIYESTVYPGCTEEDCVPVLEKNSGLKFNQDFYCGYSPERINPGDKVNTLTKIKKVTSGSTPETAIQVDELYKSIITAGTHLAPSMKVAEASKAIENAQRDVNISFVNELALIFDRMNIDTQDVLAAAGTKWNFLKFQPGLVGGHCIGVDPYYFVYEAEKLGYHSQIILSGRKINDGMGKFVADAIIKKLILANKVVRQAKVVILGITFKENTPDTRNSKVVDIIDSLREYGIEPIVVDPEADADEAKHEYGIDLVDIRDVNDADCLVLAVAHDIFKQKSWDEIDSLYGEFDNGDKVLIDVKSILNKKEIEEKGYSYWRL